MTKQTYKKSITKMVEGIMLSNNVSPDKHPKLWIDLSSAFHRFLLETEDGETPAQARERIAAEFAFGGNTVTSERARMMQVIMDTIGVDVDEGNSDWQAVISHCLEAEKRGETVQAFREWMNKDPYNSPKKHQIAQSPTIIKKVWRSAFETKPAEARPEYTPYKASEDMKFVPRPK